MIEIKEVNIKNNLLKTYVEGYGLMKISGTSIYEKELLPWPGASWLFVNQPFSINHVDFRYSCVFGLRGKSASFKWKQNDLEVLAVKFAPYGLSQFIDFPMEELINKTIYPEDAWAALNLKNPLQTAILNSTSIDEKIHLIEDFLISVLHVKPYYDAHIVQFIYQIITDPSINISELKINIPFSNRQFERKFKLLVGTNLKTFVRICRFYYTKMVLLQKNNIENLTDLGYDAGYFDQAHFSKEFKKFSSSSPRSFPKKFPLFNLIADEHLKK